MRKRAEEEARIKKGSIERNRRGGRGKYRRRRKRRREYRKNR